MKTFIALPTLLVVTLAWANLAGAAPLPSGKPPSGDPVSGRSIYQLGAPWTDDAGASFRLADLGGHPVVIAMIYTRCAFVCPLMVAQMKELERALPKSVRSETRFVLVSFDTEGDTPSVLHAYRAHSGLDAKRWILLHGNPDQIRDLAMVLGVSYAQVAPGLFGHTSLVSVLNRKGEITFQRPSLQDAMAEAVQAVGAVR